MQSVNRRARPRVLRLAAYSEDRPKMPNRRIVAKELGELLKVLSHPDRIQIVQLLAARGEHSVNSIAEALDLPGTRISQHLAALRVYRLVEEQSVGRQRIYRLTPQNLAEWLVGGVDFVVGRIGDVTQGQADDAKHLWLASFEKDGDARP